MSKFKSTVNRNGKSLSVEERLAQLENEVLRKKAEKDAKKEERRLKRKQRDEELQRRGEAGGELIEAKKREIAPEGFTFLDDAYDKTGLIACLRKLRQKYVLKVCVAYHTSDIWGDGPLTLQLCGSAQAQSPYYGREGYWIFGKPRQRGEEQECPDCPNCGGLGVLYLDDLMFGEVLNIENNGGNGT